jgi:phosphate/sulfate permease
LVFEVIGMIIAAAGMIISAIFWAFLNSCSSSLVIGPVLSDLCACGVVGDVIDCKSQYYYYYM